MSILSAASAGTRVPAGLRGLWETLLDLLFEPPGACALCGQALPSWMGPEGLCRACLRRVPFVADPVCERCGKPVRPAGGAASPAAVAPVATAPGAVSPAASLCGDCRRWPRAFQQAVAAGVYDGVLREMLHALKYRGQTHLAPVLGRWMAVAVGRRPAMLETDCIVAVPLHPERLLRRAFNQAELLAAVVSRETGIPLETGLVVRTGGSGVQSRLGREARLRNLRRAFEVLEPSRVRGARVLVVDDVLTTGSTLDQMARALLRAGAAAVYGTCAAAGVLDREIGAGGGKG